MKNNKKGLWGVIVAIGLFLLSKLKWVFAIFKLAKFSTVFSMFLSLGAYAVIYGWKFGVALEYLLFGYMRWGIYGQRERKVYQHRQQSSYHLWELLLG